MDITYGEISDSKTYTHKQIAKLWGVSERVTKEMLLDNFHCVRIGNLLLVSGLSIRLDVERLSQSPKMDENGHLPAEAQRRKRNETPPDDPRPPKRQVKS